MTHQDDQLGCLRESNRFRVEDHGGEWHIFCNRCRQAWALKKSGVQHPGNLLRLLEHSAEHDAAAKPPL